MPKVLNLTLLLDVIPYQKSESSMPLPITPLIADHILEKGISNSF